VTLGNTPTGLKLMSHGQYPSCSNAGVSDQEKHGQFPFLEPMPVSPGSMSSMINRWWAIAGFCWIKRSKIALPVPMPVSAQAISCTLTKIVDLVLLFTHPNISDLDRVAIIE
jgi:hypothetical protein